MRTLFALILGAAVSWSVFWLWGALSYKADLYEWISDRQNDGWRIEIDDIVLFGYPNRFDITLENPHISSKDVDFKPLENSSSRINSFFWRNNGGGGWLR